MKIHVEIFPWLSGLVGGKKDETFNLEIKLTQGSTIRQFLDELVAQHPAIATDIYDQERRIVKSTAVLMLNNRMFELSGGYEAILAEGDAIVLLPAYSGG
jgi:molybdopterin converting factor small subunit